MQSFSVNVRRYTPALFQLSLLVSVPLFFMVGGSVLGFGLAVALGIVGHAIGISLVGHYVISHDRHPNLPRPIAALAYCSALCVSVLLSEINS